MNEEAKQRALATWRRLTERRESNEEFRMVEALTLGEHEIPAGARVKAWRRPRPVPVVPYTLGTFFLADCQVSIMSDGRVTRRPASHKPFPAPLPRRTHRQDRPAS